MDLRDYQFETIQQIRERIRGGAKRVLTISPTGSGKTVTFSALLARAAEKGSRCLVLAHRRELIAQTQQKLNAYDVFPGIIQAGVRPAPQRPVQVASIQTLVQRDAGSKFDIVVVDEAHHVTRKNSYAKVLTRFPEAIVLGFTATPWRLDGAGLADVFESHVISRTPRQLRDEGHLVGVTGWEYAPIDTRGVKVTAGDYNTGDLGARAMSAKLFGEIIGEWKQHAGGGRTVLFACTLAHSMAMATAFRAAGVAAEHVDGDTPEAERASIFARLRSGATRVLCNVGIATEGWDLPELECVILARPTLSVALYLQMVGRVLRTAPGKLLARIHDHSRCLATHGHPYAERDWSPEHSVKGDRKSAESGVRRDTRCRECKAIIVVYPCDNCRYAPEGREIEVEANAQRKALLDTPGWDAVRARIDKQAGVAARFRTMSTEEKRQQFLKLVEKHGARKALGVYRWMSGDTEWPPAEWRLEPAVVRA